MTVRKESKMLNSQKKDPKTELRKLSPAQIQQLAKILDINDDWKKLMSIIPKEGTNKEHKFTNDQIGIVERASRTEKRSPTDIFLEEWSTMGRNRVNLGELLNFLIQAKLYRGADFLSTEILGIPIPNRPDHGPGSQVVLSKEELEKLIQQRKSGLKIQPSKPGLNMQTKKYEPNIQQGKYEQKIDIAQQVNLQCLKNGNVPETIKVKENTKPVKEVTKSTKKMTDGLHDEIEQTKNLIIFSTERSCLTRQNGKEEKNETTSRNDLPPFSRPNIPNVLGDSPFTDTRSDKNLKKSKSLIAPISISDNSMSQTNCQESIHDPNQGVKEVSNTPVIPCFLAPFSSE